MPERAIRIRLGNWDELQPLAAPIRFAVFVDEQHVPPELELDEHDAGALHAVAFDADGTAIGTGRLLPDGYIGRMAVLARARSLGVGTRLLVALMDAARGRGLQTVMLNAQTAATGFYARLGFEPQGETFLDAGIVHRKMVRRLQPAAAESRPARSG
jgi:predicted GNAT family N-acyltransferase